MDTVDVADIQVREIYNRWNDVWENKDLEMSVRLKAYSILNVLEALVFVYENDGILEEEDIDDLFVSWGDGIYPLLPEDTQALFEKLKNRLDKK